MENGDPLRVAIINRIACPKINQQEEVEELERLLREHFANKLAKKLLEKA